MTARFKPQLPHALPAIASPWGPSNVTNIALNNLDMALAISQSQVNEIAALNALPQSAVNIASGAVSFTGQLNPMSGSAPLVMDNSCHVPGIVAQMQMTGTAVVNGNTYQGSFSIVGLPTPYELQEEPQPNSAAQSQLTTLQQTYGDAFAVYSWGLDYGQMEFPPQPCGPADWRPADWQSFCNVLAQEWQQGNVLTSNGQVALVQGIKPNSLPAAWNFGPTDWCCFNVPPSGLHSQAALVFGFMVAGNSMGQNPQNDFEQAQLFTLASSGQANALLLVSGNIVANSMVKGLVNEACLTEAASYGISVSNQPNGSTQAFSIAPNMVSPTTLNVGQPCLFAVTGSTTQTADFYASHCNTSAQATTATGAMLQFTLFENGMWQALQASGSFTVSGNTGGNQRGWQFTVPAAIFTWSITAELLVSQDGGVTFSVAAAAADHPPSFTNTPLNNASSDGGWWTTALASVDTLQVGLIQNAVQWGSQVQPGITAGFCPPGNNQQLNWFFFPGGAMWQDAAGGINQAGTLVVNLTYVYLPSPSDAS